MGERQCGNLPSEGKEVPCSLASSSTTCLPVTSLNYEGWDSEGRRTQDGNAPGGSGGCSARHVA